MSQIIFDDVSLPIDGIDDVAPNEQQEQETPPLEQQTTTKRLSHLLQNQK